MKKIVIIIVILTLLCGCKNEEKIDPEAKKTMIRYLDGYVSNNANAVCNEILPEFIGSVFDSVEDCQNEYESVSTSLTNDNIISLPSSPKTVYAWLDGNKLLYYSDADVIFMHEYSGDLFNFYSNGDSRDKFVSIDISGWNSVNPSNFSDIPINLIGIFVK